MSKKRTHYSKAERKEQIINLLVSWLRRDNQFKSFTTYTIARGLDMSRSSHIQKMLDELVANGVLVSASFQKPGRVAGVYYSLNPEKFQLPGCREIKINGKLWAVQQAMQL